MPNEHPGLAASEGKAIEEARLTPPPRRAGRPRREDAERLDDRVLDAARQSFIVHGFGKTTIERVALQTGTTRRSVMHRFTDKDALLYAVAERTILSNINDIIYIRVNADAPMERLRAICRALLHTATAPDNYALFRVYVGEIGRLPHLSDLVIHYNNLLEQGIERAVMAVQETGKFRHYSAAAVATSAIGMMLSNPINRAMLGDPQFHDTHKIDLYFSQMWAIFLLMA